MKKFISKLMIIFLITISLIACENKSKVRTENIETVRTFLKLLEEEKIEQFVNLFSENGKQVNPYSSGLFPAEIVGKKALLEFWKPVPNRFDGMQFPIKKIHKMHDSNLLLVEFDGKIKLKNNAGVYTNKYYCLFKFNNDGKIVEYVEIFNPLEVVKAFNLKDKI